MIDAIYREKICKNDRPFLRADAFNPSDIEEMVDRRHDYGFGQVSVLQCFIPYTRQLAAPRLKGIHVVGNVSFPSGSDTTSIKIAQAREMLAAGCDEIDMVMNIGRLRSGEIAEVEEDVRAVIGSGATHPGEGDHRDHGLTPAEVKQACNICVGAVRHFVKTGTGWAERGTTLEDVQLVKSSSATGSRSKPPAASATWRRLLAMYEAGARRFGVNLKSGIEIVEEASLWPA